MTQSVATTLHQTIEITDVADIVVTEVVDEGGIWTRAIRIFGAPAGVEGPPILEIRVKSSVKANIEITTPAVNF